MQTGPNGATMLKDSQTTLSARMLLICSTNYESGGWRFESFRVRHSSRCWSTTYRAARDLLSAGPGQLPTKWPNLPLFAQWDWTAACRGRLTEPHNSIAYCVCCVLLPRGRQTVAARLPATSRGIVRVRCRWKSPGHAFREFPHPHPAARLRGLLSFLLFCRLLRSRSVTYPP